MIDTVLFDMGGTLEDIWVDDESRVLVLGTMPSPKSRARGMYYGHPQNRFWPLMATVALITCL